MDEQMNVGAGAPVESSPSTSPAPESAPAPAPATESAPAPQTETTTAGGYKLTVDENGKRTLSRISEPTTPTEQQPLQQQQQSTDSFTNTYTAPASQQGAPQQYTLDELVTAMQSGNVDSTRVPEKYEQQYASYRISKAIEEENIRRQNQQALQAIQQQELQRMAEGGPDAVAQRLERMKDIDARADELAKKDAGFTQEDLDAFEYMDEDDDKYKAYKIHKEFHKQQIIRDLERRVEDYQMYQQRQREVYQDINIYTEQLKQSEPNFQEIDVLALNRYKTLPFEQGAKIAEVINAFRNGNISPSQAAILRRYYEDTRKEYYAGKNGLNLQAQKVAPKPPAVESTGQGVAYKRGPESMDVRDLRNASVRDRRAWLQNFFSRNNRK